MVCFRAGFDRILKLSLCKFRTFETYISFSLLKTEIYGHFVISPFRHFAISPFRHFAVSPFRRFAVSPFRVLNTPPKIDVVVACERVFRVGTKVSHQATTSCTAVQPFSFLALLNDSQGNPAAQ